MERRIPQNNLVSQPAVTDGHGFMGSTSNNATQGNQGVEFLAGYDDGGRRHSFPDHSPKKGEQRDKRSFSDAKRDIKLGDPLAKTILDRRDLLEELSRCLDKEYKYGTSRCWKHIAEHFEINEEKYQSFKCSNIHSPTEAMFEYLQTSHPEITVGKLKDKLRSIERQDVIDVLVACEKINDGSLVSSLFNSNPDIIGRVAFLLDGQNVGLETWVQLAEKFCIPKDVSKSFETCTNYNPTDSLFEYLTIHLPKMTVEELITHLKAMHRLDVVTAIEESDEVESGSSVKDLVEDVLVMEKVCELLNLKFRIKKVRGWRHLGARLKIKKDILDALSPPEEYFEGPTAAVIRHLGSWKPYLKIADFIRALETIDRLDVIDVFKGYLPDVSEQL